MAEAIDFKYSAILKNAADDTKLANLGYVVFPMLDTIAIQKLSNYYFEFQNEEPAYFYSSTHSPDFLFRRKASDFIKAILSPLLPEHLKNYTLLGGAFVVKPGHGKGVLQPHQDWNIVDETQYRSYNIWIPLVDVDANNGAVFVLPSSHLKMQTFRGPGIVSVFKNIEQEIWNDLTVLPMKAGEALLYDHALLHGSPPNRSNHVRLGVVCGIIPHGAHMQMYFQEASQLGVYRVNSDFFLDKNPLAGPQDLELIKKHLLPVQQLDLTTFKSLYIPGLSANKHNWYGKILKRLRGAATLLLWLPGLMPLFLM